MNHAQAVFEGFTVTGGFLTGDPGGGAYLQSGMITNCVFTGNVVSNAAVALRGGGIYAVGGRVVDCVISNNLLYSITGSSPWAGGGGMALDGTGYAQGCLIITNQAGLTACGGGASMHGNGARLFDCRLIGNAGFMGGGLQIFRGRASGCTIASNVATRPLVAATRTGGGVYMNGNVVTDYQLLDNSLVTGNATAGYGGGIAATYFAMVSNCVITANDAGASGTGGGIYLHFHGTVRNSLIVSNSARFGGGAALYRGGTVESCTIVGNRSRNYIAGGGGVHYEGAAGSDGNVFNSIVYFNTGYEPANWFTSGTAKKLFWTHACTIPTNGLFVSGCITNNPSFAHAGALTGTPNVSYYVLQPRSPCLDLGLWQSWMTQAFDLLGNPRVDDQSGLPDIGCLERVPPPRGTTLVVR